MEEIFTLMTFGINKKARCVDRPRLWGLFKTEDAAIARVRDNSGCGSLDEGGYYTHCLIEAVKLNTCAETRVVAWFEWSRNDDKWLKTRTPAWLENQCNFTVG